MQSPHTARRSARTKYAAFVATLPPSRRTAHLRFILAWLLAVRIARQKAPVGPPLEHL